MIACQHAGMASADKVTTGIAGVSHHRAVETESAGHYGGRHIDTARRARQPGVQHLRVGCLDQPGQQLTATECRLLEFLMSRPGVVFSREQLLNSVWGQDRAITDRAVDVYVLRLRQKVESDPANPIMIHSVRGFGYTFEPRRAMAGA